LGAIHVAGIIPAIQHKRILILISPCDAAIHGNTGLKGYESAHVAAKSAIYTDALLSYQGLNDQDFVHQTIDHAERYVQGQVHTNGLENFWSCLKRAIKGTYISVEPFHLFRYLDEQSFRFNNRKEDDKTRFSELLGSVLGRRLTYKHLIGAGLEPLQTC